MKIKNRLRLNTLISLGTVILILFSLIWSFREIVIAERNMAIVDDMQKVAFERTMLRDEYILYKGNRSKTQWHAKSETLRDLIVQADSRFDKEEDRALLRNVRKDFDLTFATMSGVMEGNAGLDRGINKKPGFSDAEQRMISQVFLKAYSLIDNITRLHESIQKKEINTRNSGLLIIMFTLLCGVIAIIANSTLIDWSVTKRIASLGKGVALIGAGDLDHRIAVEGDDELTALALASNEMASKLQQSYTSMTNLEKEIELRKRVEEDLQASETRLSEAQKMAQLGYWIWDVRTGNVEWSDEVYTIFHLDPDKFTPHIDLILALSPWPENQARDKELMRKTMESREKGEYEQKFLRPDGSIGYYYSTFQGKYDEDGSLTSIVGTVLDITERKKAEAILAATMADLKRSNEELQQFAYVASHDLQEPLRMVSSYTQLLADRYKGRLDERADKYIEYAVDGAVRMQRLINDLLDFSRVGTRAMPIETTDCNAVLKEALGNLAAMIDEHRAIITHEALPSVHADASQLVLVFQNLISNAVKFHGVDLPNVHVSAQDQGPEWVFSIKDNGLGIDQKYADKIFLLFQRLHTRQEYPGTGMGLAICKRIIQRHGGRLWFESVPGGGSTFFFTIPKYPNII